MEWERIVYQDWVVETAGQDDDADANRNRLRTIHRSVRPSVHVALAPGGAAEDKALTRLREQVGAAVALLTDDEREFIERFYYSGHSYFEIARGLQISVRRLETVHRRALRRLRKFLAPLVESYYGITKEETFSCPICLAEHRNAIDNLIGNRDRTRSWLPVIREIRNRFGIRIKSPMTLIGHEKYH